MINVFPDYYPDFHCIAGACRHNCCIGWEIDIDPPTLALYNSLPGPMGDKVRRHIAIEPEPHFILGKAKRCPFLNKDNLCDLICELGEEALCSICALHPRFRNQLPGRVEIGLGLCCEEAARLILSRKRPVQFIPLGDEEASPTDPIIVLRDRAIAILQKDYLSIPAREAHLLSLCDAALPARSLAQWADFLLGLEQLDAAWGRLLRLVKKLSGRLDLDAFDEYMAGRQHEYEQLMVYFVYRHFANAPDFAEAAARAAFAVFGYRFIRAAGCALWQTNGRFTFEDQVELARLFSSELEYSPENTDLLLDEFYNSCVSPPF